METDREPRAEPDEIVIEARGHSHIGRIRVDNEDTYLLGDLDGEEICAPDERLTIAGQGRGPLLVVCDGLGGAQAGEVASKLAAEVIWAEMRQAQATDKRQVFARLLRRAVRIANRRVWEEGQRSPSQRGMGTTVSVAGLVGDHVVLAQVGDSRAYVLRGDTLVQVTRDQSVASALVQSGQLTDEEAQALPTSNMVLQALGIRRDLEVALSTVPLRRGDCLLLCSDGLHGPISDAVIASLLALRPDPDEAVELLIEAACAAGGPDNVTAIVARFSGAGLRPPESDDDLPRFIELDHMEEGERALATTSVVGRRLAARAGIGKHPGPPVVPATGQHSVVRSSRPPRPATAADDVAGPATAALHRDSRLGPAIWVLTVAVVIAVLLVLFALT